MKIYIVRHGQTEENLQRILQGHMPGTLTEQGKEQVAIMGHKISDLDSFGAAIGVYRAARSLNKKAFIVINDITTSVRPVIDHFMDNPEYDSDTLAKEYYRDLDKGMNPKIPVNYFPDDDPTKQPEMKWSAHGQWIYSNWMNYFVYQTTPYELKNGVFVPVE